MNKDRRKRLTKIRESISNAIIELEGIKDEEYDAFENLHYSIQEGERGANMQEAMESLENAISELYSVDFEIEHAMEV